MNTFCFEECKSYCCRKGYLVLTKEESEVVAGEKLESLIVKDVVKKTDDDNYSLHINPCPSLKDNKCSIHKDPKRPTVCREFPIFLWSNKVIHVSNRCLFVKQGLLYPYLAELKLKGYKLEYE